MLTENNRRIIYPVLSILVPCMLGIIGMVSKNVPVMIWIQNPLIILLLIIGCIFTSKHNLKFSYKVIVFISVILLGLTFFGPNINGVHRWLKFPLFTLNISMIVVPITIVALNRLIEEKQIVISVIGIMVIAFLLYIQPDASQLLAFSLPVIYMLLKANISPMIKGSFAVMLPLLILRSWICLDTLEPVDHTEGILTMLHDMSAGLFIVGIATLFWIPVYFLISCPG